MKRLIFLKVPYVNIENNKLKPTELNKLKTKTNLDIIKQFKLDLKNFKYIKTIKEFGDQPLLIVEFSDDQYEQAYNDLRSIETVEVIDPILPIKEKIPEKIEKLEEISDKEYLEKLKAKMAKYKK